MRSVFEMRGGKPSERANPFVLMKPNGNGPLEAGSRGNNMLPPKVDDRIVLKIKRLGWDSEFADRVLKLKHNVFKDNRCFSEEIEGQVFSANFNLEVNGVKASLHVSRECAFAHIKTTTDEKKKRVPEIDELCNAFKKHLPGMELEKSKIKVEYTDKYLITVEGKLFHPDSAERNKRVAELSKAAKSEDKESTDIYFVGPMEGC